MMKIPPDAFDPKTMKPQAFPVIVNPFHHARPGADQAEWFVMKRKSEDESTD